MSSGSESLSGEPGGLEVTRIGSGPRIVLVHGSVVGADRTWRSQLGLASRFELVIPNRPGFGRSPEPTRGDFEAEAPLIAELLGERAHLVGHSYGAVIALYAAALAPASVASLTVSEPGCLRVAAGNPLVDQQIANGELLYSRADVIAPRDFLLAFRGGVGSANETPDELEAELERGAALLRRERPPWEADPPLELLARRPFPKLIVSGGHSPVFEAVCDATASRLGGRRAVVAGRRHTIPSTGEPYNARLAAFVDETEQGTAREGGPG